MAEENNKTGASLNQPQGSTQTKRSADELKESLKEILRLEGDYRDIVKDAIKELQSTLKTYDKMAAKLAVINKSAINIKEIESQIQRTKEENAANDVKLADFNKKISEQSKERAKKFNDQIVAVQKAEETLAKARLTGYKGLEAVALRNLRKQETSLESSKKDLNVEELKYAQLLKTEELNKEILDRQKEQLKTEEKIRSNLGLTGAVFSGFANKLGVGDKYYKSMVEKARELNKQGKQLTFGDKVKGIFSAVGGSIKETVKDPFAFVAAFSAAIPVIGGMFSGLKSAFDYILGIQDQTVKFARAMNLSTGEARKIKMEFASLSLSSGDVFINSQKMVESQMELTSALGVTNILSKEILATNIKLKDIAGLEADVRESLATSATITGNSSEETTKSVLAQVVGLKQATGIGFQYQKILKEASTLGGVLGLQFAKYPAQLTKSLLTTKALGLELKQLDSMASSFLDFESSISKEFEAQLLTGKDINLAKAREAFLNNDLATAATEITKQVGTASQFLKLNRIQQESIAEAMGMSRDDMANMLKQQELLSKLGAKQGDSAKEQLRLGLERYKSQKELTAAIGEEAYQNLINASAQEKIAAFVDKIKQSFADFVERSGIIDKIEQFIEYLSEPKNIQYIISQIRDFFAFAVESVLSITNGIINAIDFITFGFGIDEAFERKFEAFSANAGSKIRSLGGDFGTETVSNNAAKGSTGGVYSVDSGVRSMKRSEPQVSVTVNNVNDVNGRTISEATVQTLWLDSQTGFGSSQTAGN